MTGIHAKREWYVPFKNVLFVCALVGALAGRPGRSDAFVQFQKVFKELCVDESEHEEFQKICTNGRTRCLVCHQGRGGKHLNVYGAEVGKLIGKEDRRDTEKIIDAIKKVANLPFNLDDEHSETFGERIAAGKLPGGELEELKKQPAKLAEEAGESASDGADEGS